MTKDNEQIIIDVNNCLYHDNGKCRNSEIGQCNCANVASCYYKECKRTEQEYKFWLHQAKLGSETTDRLAKELEEKEQECEELKEEIKTNGFGLFNIEMSEQLDLLKKENDTLFKAIEEVNKINKRLESENEELKKQLESTKGLVTVGNKQLTEALLELQKYKDNEQQEKEMQKLYNKFEGSSLIEKSSPYEN